MQTWSTLVQDIIFLNMNVLYSHLEGEYRKEPHVNKCALMILKKKTTTLKCYWIGSWLHLVFIYTLLLYCNSSITPVWMRTESERKKRNKLINQTHFFLQIPPRAVSRWPSWTPGSASWPSARPETNLQHPKQCESMKSLLRHTQESFRTSMISHYHKSAF